MGIKPGSRAHLVGTPAAAFAAMQLPALVESPDLDGEFDYLHLFTTSRASLEGAFPTLKRHVKATGMLWVSWPKARKARHRSLLADRDQTRVLEPVGRKHLLERGRHLVGPQVHASEEGQELPQQPRCATSDVTVGFERSSSCISIVRTKCQLCPLRDPATGGGRERVPIIGGRFWCLSSPVGS